MVLAVSMAMLMAVTSDLFAVTANAEPEMDEYDRIIYHIDSVQDLYAIEDDMSGHYILDTDLDISSECIGNGWIPIGANDKYELVKMFRGLFDGNGHTITGMNISIADLGVSHEGAMYLGLFKCKWNC